jgi:DNA-binding NarL/FixJ family response regulator
VARVTVSSSFPAVRAGLERILEGDREIEVEPRTGAASGPSQISLAETDVVVVSADPLWRGLLAEILDAPEARPAVVLVTDDESDSRFLSTRAAGRLAWAALPASVSPVELRRAVLAVAAGLVVIHPALAPPLLAPGSSDSPEPEAGLTDREREVLDLMSKGFSNPEIAGLLGISENTVKFHTSSVYAKLGVANRTEAVRVGIRSGEIHL